MKVFVEGGGNTQALKTECRKGFSEFLKKAGLTGHLPQIVACGGRGMAFDKFFIAVQNNEPAMLLVDSEAPISPENQQGGVNLWHPWAHLKNRQGDEWNKPPGASDMDCHFMVQCMETWFIADRETLCKFFGQGFNMNALPAVQNPIESIEKETVYRSLENASRDCKVKAKYGKGEHSFKILALINPDLITTASPWAKRFVNQVKARMGL